MVIRRFGVLAIALAMLIPLLTLPASDAGAETSTPAPFGLSCHPAHGFRLCPGGFAPGADLRVKSFDGVPLDTSVALPPTGAGPFPTIVLLHGLGGSKSDWMASSPDGKLDDATLAAKGYAVVMYTARGFGDSCGVPASRTAGCASGYIRLADQRYEVRDTQFLTGTLVDEHLALPGIGAAGISYGGGQSLELATLKNRIELPSGRFIPFTSPMGTPMHVAGVFAMWPWEDLATSLTPNGRLSSTSYTRPSSDIIPPGVEKEAWIDLLYGVNQSFYLPPVGADPQADQTTWTKIIRNGEPYGADAIGALRYLQRYHSALGIPLPAGGPAPTALQSGWTDTLFPVSEGQHFILRNAAAHASTPELALYADIGHGWATGRSGDLSFTVSRGISFLLAAINGHPQVGRSVVALPVSCAPGTSSGHALTAPTMAKLSTHSIVLSTKQAGTVSSSGGDPGFAASLNSAYSSAKVCDSHPTTAESGVVDVMGSALKAATTVVGAASISVSGTLHGSYPELVGLLYDVNSAGSSRQVVSLGIVRPVARSCPSVSACTAALTTSFQLNPVERSIAAGHHLELELRGSLPPTWRPSDGSFMMSFTNAKVTIPTR